MIELQNRRITYMNFYLTPDSYELNSRNLPYTFYRTNFTHQCFQFRGIIEHYRQITAKKSVIRVYTNASHYNLFFLCNDACDIVDDGNIIIPNHMKCNRVLRSTLTTPFCFNQTISKTFT